MYTSILVFAVAGLAPAADARQTPSWLTDYSLATQLAASQKKPLAVFLASGKVGWEKLSTQGELPHAAKEILASDYVCLHVDTGTEPGKLVAESFGILDGLGIVISDRAGQLQAFRHEGDLPEQDLVRYLERYADPDLVVHITETNPSARTSYYAPAVLTGAPSYGSTISGGAGRC